MSQRSSQALRQQLAAEAARIIAEQGFADYDAARRKAAQRLRVRDRRQWPENAEIAAALEAYRGLFQPDDREEVLRRLRHVALQAMELLAEFSPRLVGSVGDGSAVAHSPVTLHLTADSVKTVVIGLLNRGVGHATDERPVRFADGVARPRPLIRFAHDDVEVIAVVLEPADRSRPPLDPVTAKPQRGLDLQQLQLLLESDAQPRSVIGT